jgi:putative copper resistance protein D
MGFLAAIAFTGHAGATPGVVGDLHLASDIVHLVAAGAWLGGLPPFMLLLATAERSADAAWTDAAAVATRRFSLVGTASVVALAVTGTANTWILVGGPAGLAATDYGRLLALKICLFAAMVGVAAFNRLHLTPRLAAPGTVRRLRHNSLIETGLGLLVIAIVSTIGTMAPEIHRMH